MQIDVFQRSVSDPDLSIGLAQHRGTHYRFIASNSVPASARHGRSFGVRSAGVLPHS